MEVMWLSIQLNGGRYEGAAVNDPKPLRHKQDISVGGSQQTILHSATFPPCLITCGIRHVYIRKNPPFRRPFVFTEINFPSVTPESPVSLL